MLNAYCKGTQNWRKKLKDFGSQNRLLGNMCVTFLSDHLEIKLNCYWLRNISMSWPLSCSLANEIDNGVQTILRLPF